MNKKVHKLKSIERMLRMYREKAAKPPLPNIRGDEIIGYDYEWQEYCTEIREFEAALREAGEI